MAWPWATRYGSMRRRRNGPWSSWRTTKRSTTRYRTGRMPWTRCGRRWQTSWARTAFRSLHSGMPRHTRDATTARSWMRTSKRSARTPTRAWTGCRKQRRRSYKKPPSGQRTRSRQQKKTAGPEPRRRSIQSMKDSARMSRSGIEMGCRREKHSCLALLARRCRGLVRLKATSI